MRLFLALGVVVSTVAVVGQSVEPGAPLPTPSLETLKLDADVLDANTRFIACQANLQLSEQRLRLAYDQIQQLIQQQYAEQSQALIDQRTALSKALVTALGGDPEVDVLNWDQRALAPSSDVP